MAPQKQWFGGVLYRRNRLGYYYSDPRAMHRVVWEHHNGSIPDGYHVHHKDGDPSNNDISNLEVVRPEVHSLLHRHSPRSKFKERLPVREATCGSCGKSFPASRSNSKWCSNRCRVRKYMRKYMRDRRAALTNC